MNSISDVISKLESLKAEYGDIEVRIVNYHSDFRNDSIRNLNDAIGHVIYEGNEYILIGGETA